MVGKTAGCAEEVSVEAPSSSVEKSQVQHEESVDQAEKSIGLRIDGDDLDHEHEPKMTLRRFMSLLAMALLWTGSQIPVYLYGSIPPYIYGDIGGLDRWIWFVLGNLLALAGVCPFVGSLSDLLGRRYVALMGAGLLVLGTVIATTARSMNMFIAGTTIAGAAAGISELTALAVTSEMAPTRKRGAYVAVLIFTIVPFLPSGLYAQMIASHAGWRYCGMIICIWNGLGLIITALFYFPPPRVNSKGKSRQEVLREIDYVGGLLSISGMVLFMAGLQWGGYQYSWSSPHALVPLILGAVLIVLFIFWEAYGAEYPMFPKRLKQDPRILGLTLIITFISGANFFSYLMFWPTQAFNVYGHNPAGVGLRVLPGGIAIMVGACITLWLLSVFRGRNKELMIISCILMTAGSGALACATPDNMDTLWGLLVLGGLGIGGIVVPASIITTIICPDDLIATVSALTLAIRVIGGSVGYCAYYNVFISKFDTNVVKYVGTAMYEVGITNTTDITQAIVLTGASLIQDLKTIPGLANETAYQLVVAAGQLAYSESYRYVYLASIAAGGVSIIAACFLGDINKYMDEHVAVVIE
ncbi:hypothetical protein AYL99_06657 [Fonsecaea erecta]|uniref:Major facilitator superfamily (MFS) profile domain-containing protein n=1 Tax=Fonsecaea erecta TaxID=1367422 RepID=A0A178ZHS9_9EURO|nr:hypothetical protein AYL99_06657 [Fonsecaea erecta]OAP59359.1 hypothetical protein AYL99_06657 [Fonsecaea erecta]